MTLRILIQVAILAVVGIALIYWVARHPRDFFR